MRLGKIEKEWGFQNQFDYSLINDKLDVAIDDANKKINEFLTK
jgi:guanylate kinase